METREKKIGLVIHGGAGTIARSKTTPEIERDLRAGLERLVAISEGKKVIAIFK
jgi:hypothetical protein